MKLTLAAVACAATIMAAPQLAGATEMKYASATPEKTPWVAEMREQEARIEANSNNDINVEIFTSGSLGDELTLVQSVRRGRVQGAYVSTAPLASVVPEIGVLEIPFLWNSAEERDFVMDNYLADAYQPLFEDAGLKLLSWSEIGSSSIATDKHLITPADAEGLRIRIPQSKVASFYIDRLGAVPSDIPVMDTGTALQTGLVDGVFTTTIALFFFDFYKEASHVTMGQDIYYASTHIVSKRWFDTLSEEQQASLLDGAQDNTAASRARIRAVTGGLAAKIEESGVNVKHFTDEERAVWQEYFAKDTDAILEMLGGKSADIYAKVVEGKAAFAAQAN